MKDFRPRSDLFGGGGGGGGGAGAGGSMLDQLTQLDHISITPRSFNSTTTLGRSTNLLYGATSDQMLQGIKTSETVAYWQADKTEAQAMSVDIGLVLPPTPTFVQGLANPRDARAYALIEWGIDGYRQAQVAIDVGLGRRISIPANYIAVTVGVDPPGPGMVPAPLTVGAGITAFASPSQAPVIRTRYIDALLQDAFSNLLPIPLRAVELLPPLVGDATVGAPVPPGILSINFFGFDAQQIAQWQFDFTTQASGMSPQPLPPDAFAFRVMYTGGAPGSNSNIRVPFGLSL